MTMRVAGRGEREATGGRRRNRRSLRRGLRGLAAACLAAVALLSLGTPEVTAQQPPAVVSVDEVRMEAMAQTVPVIGRLVARRAGQVAARTAGPVAELHVEVGDRVETGEPIAVLDTVRLRAERDRLAAVVNQAQAQVESLTAQAALRRQELRRLEGLRDSAAFSQGRFEDARQEVIIAESAIGSADAARVSAAASLSLAQIDLSWATITAPYPGVITTVHTEVGAWLAIGQPVVSLINDVDLEVEAEVPSSRVAGLNEDMEVALVLDDGSEHTAVVAHRRAGGERADPHPPGPLHAALRAGAEAARGQSVGDGDGADGGRARGAHRAQGRHRPQSGPGVRLCRDGRGRRRSARCSWALPWAAASWCWADSAPGEPVVVRWQRAIAARSGHLGRRGPARGARRR